MADPFFRNGLKFDCVRCSACCRYTPGYVFLSLEDLERIARATGTDINQASRKYCRVVDISGFKRLSLKEKANLDCIFWQKGGCDIYEARPLQCRSFPFWPSNLVSLEAWQSLTCKGIDRGLLHSRETIEKWLKRRQTESLIVIDDKSI